MAKDAELSKDRGTYLYLERRAIGDDQSTDDWIETGIVKGYVRNVRMGVLPVNARKTDGSELWNTLEGTEHGKGAEVRNEVRKKGEVRNIYRRGERLGLSLCAVPSPRRMWGVFRFTDGMGLRNNEGIVSGIVTQARKRIRTEY